MKSDKRLDINFSKLSEDEKEELVIKKWLDYEPMSLDEAAYAIWMAEGRKGKPMTRTGAMKLENRAFAKMRLALAEAGIGPEVLQAFGNCKRQHASGSYGNSVDCAD